MDPHLNEIRGVQSHVNLSSREERGSISDQCFALLRLRFKVNIEVIVTRYICKVAAIKVSISAQTRLSASQDLPRPWARDPELDPEATLSRSSITPSPSHQAFKGLDLQPLLSRASRFC
ncbi:hypothetical protein FALCPG4_006597 [Fusarium falciforme]